MLTTYVKDGTAYGPDGAVLNAARIGHRFISEMMQPWLDDKNRPCVTLPIGKPKLDNEGKPVVNANGPVFQKMDFLCSDLRKMGYDHPVWNATFMRKNDWYKVQERVIEANRTALVAWNDLAAANPFTGFDGMGTYSLEYEMENDPGEAVRNMEIIGELINDQSQYKIGSIPLPVTQAGFWYTQRRLANANSNGRNLSSRTAERAGYAIGKSMERVTVGVSTGVTWGTRSTGVQPHEGTSTEYGYMTTPAAYIKTDLHTPTSANPENVIEDIAEMHQTLIEADYEGPFAVYYSVPYERFLVDDYFRTGGNSATRTLRERIMALGDIRWLKRLPILKTGYTLIMTDMTRRTAEAAIGMPLTTVQWPEIGGAIQKFRVMMIGAPLIHRNFAGNTGIIWGTAP